MIEKTIKIDKTTLIPVGSVVAVCFFVGTLVVHFFSVQTLAEANRNSIMEVKEERKQIVEKLSKLERLVSKIDGKIDIMLKEKKAN